MESCNLCELHKGCRTINIQPDGRGPIVFLGEAPGAEEDARGKPFIGKSGAFLRKMIELLGLGPEDIRFTNAVRCRPPDNKTPKKSHIKACQVHLEEEFMAHPPAIIVPLGNVALEALRAAGFLELPGKITALNSRAIDNGKGPIIYPIFHPAYVLRNPGMLEAYGKTFDGLERIILEGVPEPATTEYTLSEDIDELYEAIKTARAAGVVAYDIETSFLHPQAPGARFVSFSLSWKERQAFGFWLTDTNYDDALSLLHDHLLEDPEVLKIMHHAKFELMWSMSLGRMIFNFDDTMLFHWHLDERNRTHSLKDLALNYTDMGFYDAELERYKAEHKECDPDKEYSTPDGARLRGSYANIPREVLLPYNCKDADATLRIHGVLKPQLNKAQSWVYQKIQTFSCYSLAEMELLGCNLDWNQAEFLGEEMRLEIERLKAELMQMPAVVELDEYLKETRDGKGFNPASADDLRKLLFQVLALPVVYDTDGGKPSTDKHVLAELAPKHPIPNQILRIRAISTQYNTFVLGAFKRRRADRLHTSYGMAHTETGRYNSSNPNLQNIPRSPIVLQRGEERTELSIKSMYVPDEITDWLVQVDYSQVELRIMAIQSGDKTLLDYFRQGFDVHRYVAARIHQVEPEQISSEQRTMAKRTVFGLIYGQSAAGLAEELGITVRKADAFLSKFFREFPSVREWMEATERRVKKSGRVETMFGRIRRLPDAASDDEALRSRALRQAINAPIQGTAADFLAYKKGQIWADMKVRGLAARQILTVHDSILFNVPQEEIGFFIPYAKRFMEDFSEIKEIVIPIVADFEFGKRWSSMRKLTDQDIGKIEKSGFVVPV